MTNYTAIEKSERIPEVVLKDPVHDYVHIYHQVVLDLIDTKEFQRLRRIKQLGTSQYVFHGAEHSRFAHCLGAYELARKIINHFNRNYPKYWDNNDRLVTICAALLHDLGHGPFSHTFEKIFDTNHEQVTIDIILDPDTEVNRVLKRISSDFPVEVASVIQKTHPNPKVIQLISSQIDADRMDYLQRDAYFTGVNYGIFDLSRILKTIRPYEDGIAIKYSGMHAVEDYIVSRYQMYMQVYFHPVSRGMEVTLDRLLTRAGDLHLEGNLYPNIDALTPFFENNWTLSDYLKLDDSVILYAINQWQDSSDQILRELSKMFLNRHPLKSIGYKGGKDDDTVQKLIDLVDQLHYNSRYFTKTNRSSDLSYDYSLKGQSPILLMHPDGQLVELPEESDIVRILSDHLHGNDRLYVPAELLQKKPSKELNLFEPLLAEFQSYIHNGEIVGTE